MKKVLLVAVLAAACAAPAMAVNLITNGDFSAGTTGWTQESAPWGGGYVIQTDNGYASLRTPGGSFALMQSFTSVPGKSYTVTTDWAGAGSNNWIEVLFFNDDGRSAYDQMDAPANSSVILKVDGWGMNGGMPLNGGDVVPSPAIVGAGTKWFPSGLMTNTILATGTKMWVAVKTGASGGSTVANFDNVVVTPEPATMSLLALGGLALIRRRRHA